MKTHLKNGYLPAAIVFVPLIAYTFGLNLALSIVAGVVIGVCIYLFALLRDKEITKN